MDIAVVAARMLGDGKEWRQQNFSNDHRRDNYLIQPLDPDARKQLRTSSSATRATQQTILMERRIVITEKMSDQCADRIFGCCGKVSIHLVENQRATDSRMPHTCDSTCLDISGLVVRAERQCIINWIINHLQFWRSSIDCPDFTAGSVISERKKNSEKQTDKELQRCKIS